MLLYQLQTTVTEGWVAMEVQDARSVVERLVEAVNRHELDALVGCFAEDYRNETPAHPSRGFRGRGQVRQNWSRILATVTDLHATVVRSSFDASTAWTEWEMSGSRGDGAALLLRGVMIYEIRDGSIASARFYLEPVDEAGTDVNEAVRAVVGTVDHKGPEDRS
jgi:ketosteroid isomerase-like protein